MCSLLRRNAHYIALLGILGMHSAAAATTDRTPMLRVVGHIISIRMSGR